MNLIFSILKKLKKYGFNFLQTQKSSMKFCKADAGEIFHVKEV